MVPNVRDQYMSLPTKQPCDQQFPYYEASGVQVTHTLGGCCDHQESFITLTCLLTEITISNDRMFVIGKLLQEIKNYETGNGFVDFYLALSAANLSFAI